MNASPISSRFDFGVTLATSGAISLTHSGVANTKGAWTSVISSTRFNANWLLVGLGSATVGREYFVDIGIGAASSEVVVCPNLMTAEWNAVDVTYHAVPVSVPAGTRIAARQQNASTTGQQRVIIYPFNGHIVTASPRMVDYGTNTSTTRAVSVDPGGTINTKGVWTEITSATSRDHSLLWVSLNGQDNSARTSCGWLLDIGVGGAGNEVVILPNLRIVSTSTSSGVSPFHFGPFYVPVRAGTRIVARSQCSISDATDRLFGVAAYGM